jgi:hypothetical protein
MISIEKMKCADCFGNSRNDQLTTGFALLQYPYLTLGSLHVPVLLLRLRLTVAGTRRKPTTLCAILDCKEEEI